MLSTPSGIIDITGYQDQLEFHHGSRLPKNTDQDATRGNPAEDTVNISSKARELQQDYQGEKTTLEQNYNVEAQQLEREYLLEKNELEREFSQKKQSLEIDIFA